MLANIFEHIGGKIKGLNPWINSYAVNCIQIPVIVNKKITNRVVNFEGQEKTDYGFDDSKGYGFYIRTSPKFTFTNGRRFSSCDPEFIDNIDFSFVFFSINSDFEISSLKLESLFTNQLRLMNFGDYTGLEKNIKIILLNSNPNAIDVFKSESGIDYNFGANLVAIQINARLTFELSNNICEESCLDDYKYLFCDPDTDSTHNECLPVTILDGEGNVIATVQSGGEYICEGGSTGGEIEVYLDNVLVDTKTTTNFNTEILNIDWQ